MEVLSGNSRRYVIAALLVAAFAGGLIGFLKKRTSELPVYTKAAARMRAGDPIYVPNESKPFTYPPFFALPFVPLEALDDDWQRPVWYVVNVLVVVLILRLLWSAFAPFLETSRGPPRWVFGLLTLLLAGRHLSAVFENQSHDLLVMLAVVLAIVASAKRRELRTGAWAGIGGACKATPMLFAPMLFWQRRYLAATIALIFAAGMTFLPDLVTPQSSGELWVQSWFDTFVGKIRPGDTAEAAGAWSPWNILNQNLAGTIHRLSAPPPFVDRAHMDVRLWDPQPDTLRYVKLAAQLAVVGLVAFALRPSRSRDVPERELAFRRLLEGGVLVAAMVLLSPMSSKSHFCVLLIPIAAVLADFLYRKRDVIVALLLILIFASGTLTAKGIWGRELGNEILARGSVTLCALACLFAAAHVLEYRRPEREASS